MTKFKLALPLILFSLGTAEADQILTGQVIISVPAQLCTGAIQQVRWNTPTTIKIAKIQIWNGLDYGFAADVIENVVRISDGAMLINANHDDYLNGGPVRIQKEDWGGNVFTLAAGDGLTLSYSCNPAGTHHGAWNVTIWTK